MADFDRSRLKSDSINELFQCKICFETLTVPKTLPCGHVFCLNCLEKLEQMQDNGFLASCPLCRKPPSQGVKARNFPNAYMAIQMMDYLPYMRANDCNTDRMIDVFFNLMKKREDMKEQEKVNLINSLGEEKKGIEQKINEVHSDLLERVKETLNLRKESLLRNVKRRHDLQLSNMSSRIQQMEEPSAVKTWIKANITEELQVKENLMNVLPMETHDLEGEFSEAEILNSMDPDRILRSLSSDRHKHRHSTRKHGNVGRMQETERHTDDGPRGLISTDTSTRPTVGFGTSDDSISEETTCPFDGRLRSTSSDINRHGHLLQRDNIVDRIQGTVDDTEDVPKSLKSTDTSMRPTSVFGTSEDSISDKTTCPFEENRTAFDVNVQRWIDIDEAAYRPESPSIQGAACASRSTLRSVDEKGLKMSMRVSKGRLTAASVRIHVDDDSTCIAGEVEQKTEMQVFSNKNTIRPQRRLRSTMSETMPTGIVAITSLSEHEGWCMLFKSVLLVFDYHGRAKVVHQLDGTSILCATSHKRGHFVYVNDVYSIGLISVTGGNFTKKDMESNQPVHGGVFLDIAASGDILVIAHAEEEGMDGNVTCYKGLDSQRYLQRVRCISSPSGFAKERCHPVSICCNQRGTLFALWRDMDDQRGIVMEYRVDDMESLATIAVENASDVATITCSPEGFLVTATLK